MNCMVLSGCEEVHHCVMIGIRVEHRGREGVIDYRGVHFDMIGN